jgi:hypothetical protein
MDRPSSSTYAVLHGARKENCRREKVDPRFCSFGCVAITTTTTTINFQRQRNPTPARAMAPGADQRLCHPISHPSRELGSLRGLQVCLCRILDAEVLFHSLHSSMSPNNETDLDIGSREPTAAPYLISTPSVVCQLRDAALANPTGRESTIPGTDVAPMHYLRSLLWKIAEGGICRVVGQEERNVRVSSMPTWSLFMSAK